MPPQTSSDAANVMEMPAASDKLPHLVKAVYNETLQPPVASTDAVVTPDFLRLLWVAVLFQLTRIEARNTMRGHLLAFAIVVFLGAVLIDYTAHGTPYTYTSLSDLTVSCPWWWPLALYAQEALFAFASQSVAH